ncbi:hypothetical protein JCM30760_05670 [Thiomicrorhabdus hydrogeniphila]
MAPKMAKDIGPLFELLAKELEGSNVKNEINRLKTREKVVFEFCM